VFKKIIVSVLLMSIPVLASAAESPCEVVDSSSIAFKRTCQSRYSFILVNKLRNNDDYNYRDPWVGLCFGSEKQAVNAIQKHYFCSLPMAEVKQRRRDKYYGNCRIETFDPKYVDYDSCDGKLFGVANAQNYQSLSKKVKICTDTFSEAVSAMRQNAYCNLPSDQIYGMLAASEQTEFDLRQEMAKKKNSIYQECRILHPKEFWNQCASDYPYTYRRIVDNFLGNTCYQSFSVAVQGMKKDSQCQSDLD